MTQPAPSPHTTAGNFLLGRAAQIGRVLTKYGLRELFGPAGGADPESMRHRARAMRDALEELGPTFAKLGQILSTRPDLLPAEFIEELATLQDRVAPMPADATVAVLEEALGKGWRGSFRSFDLEPLAAGTIGQVHRAVLTNGDPVVVKVQRRDAEESILEDLGLFELFAEKAGRREGLRQVVDIPAVFEHLSASLRRELDFRKEAASITTMREVLASYTRLEVPVVHEAKSSKKLLVMQEVGGVPVRDAPAGEARLEAARQLLESYYRQILTEGFFHADPHPGNLRWWDEKIWFLDFGMVGELDADTREQLLLVLMAFWQGDAAFLADVVLTLAGEEQRSDLDIAAFREELGGIISRHRSGALREVELGPLLQDITGVSLRQNVRIPASLALAGKALAQMQLTVAELDPDLDPFDVAGDYLVRSVLGRVRDRVNPRRLFYDMQKLRVRVASVIEALERLVGARPGPKLQVNFGGLERLEETIMRASRRLALALGAGSSLVAGAVTATSERVAAPIPVTLLVVGGGFSVALAWDLFRRER